MESDKNEITSEDKAKLLSLLGELLTLNESDRAIRMDALGLNGADRQQLDAWLNAENQLTRFLEGSIGDAAARILESGFDINRLWHEGSRGAEGGSGSSGSFNEALRNDRSRRRSSPQTIG